MIVVEEKQFSEKVIAQQAMVGAELSEYKGNMLSQGNAYIIHGSRINLHWKCCDLLRWPAGSQLRS